GGGDLRSDRLRGVLTGREQGQLQPGEVGGLGVLDLHLPVGPRQLGPGRTGRGEEPDLRNREPALGQQRAHHATDLPGRPEYSYAHGDSLRATRRRAQRRCSTAKGVSYCKGGRPLGPPRLSTARGATPLDPRVSPQQGGRPPWTPASLHSKGGDPLGPPRLSTARGATPLDPRSGGVGAPWVGGRVGRWVRGVGLSGVPAAG